MNIDINYDLNIDETYKSGSGEILLYKTEAAIKFIKTVPENILKRAKNYAEMDDRNFCKYNPDCIRDSKSLEILTKVINASGRNIGSETLDDHIELAEDYILESRIALFLNKKKDLEVWFGVMKHTVSAYVRKIARIAHVFLQDKKPE
jgi:hypothetical protein